MSAAPAPAAFDDAESNLGSTPRRKNSAESLRHPVIGHQMVVDRLFVVGGARRWV
jgi:hypothetical protein